MRQAKFLTTGVDSMTPVGYAATRILRVRSRRMFDLEPAAASGTDVDAVHDMRVASRRTREALDALAPAFKPKTVDELIAIAKSVTGSLGAVRDADVFIAEFSAMAEAAKDPEETLALAYIIGQRQAKRTVALRRMRRHLGKLDLKQSRKRFRRVAANTRKGAGDTPLTVLAHDVLDDRLDSVYAHLPAALEEENAPEQHSMRIAFKHLRYAVETFAPCFDGSFSRTHNTLISFQNVLGEIHDLDLFTDTVQVSLDSGEFVLAGVSPAGIEAVLAKLARRRANAFRRFSRLMERYPEDSMRERVLSSLLEPDDDLLDEPLDAHIPDAADPAGSGEHLAIPLGAGDFLVALAHDEPEPPVTPATEQMGEPPE